MAAVPAMAAAHPGGRARSWHARAIRAARVEMRHVVAPNRPAPLPGSLRAAHPAVAQGGSFNWSGYADSSTTKGAFSSVSASWTVPAVTCTTEDRQVALWVGLDGATDSTVEQDGTSSWCYEGKPVYYSWYEMYPAGSVEVGTKVKAGDKITASVKRTGTTYVIKLTDATTAGNNISETKTCAAATCLDESAEWIAERPAFTTTGIIPLAQFNTPVSFTAGAETASGKAGVISTVSPEQIFMIDSLDNYELASPSALNAAGNAFTAKWLNSY